MGTNELNSFNNNHRKDLHQNKINGFDSKFGTKAEQKVDIAKIQDIESIINGHDKASPPNIKITHGSEQSRLSPTVFRFGPELIETITEDFIVKPKLPKEVLTEDFIVNKNFPSETITEDFIVNDEVKLGPEAMLPGTKTEDFIVGKPTPLPQVIPGLGVKPTPLPQVIPGLGVKPTPLPIGTPIFRTGPEPVQLPIGTPIFRTGPELVQLPEDKAIEIAGIRTGPELVQLPEGKAIEIAGIRTGPELVQLPEGKAIEIAGIRTGPEMIELPGLEVGEIISGPAPAPLAEFDLGDKELIGGPAPEIKNPSLKKLHKKLHQFTTKATEKVEKLVEENDAKALTAKRKRYMSNLLFRINSIENLYAQRLSPFTNSYSNELSSFNPLLSELGLLRTKLSNLQSES